MFLVACCFWSPVVSGQPPSDTHSSDLEESEFSVEVTTRLEPQEITSLRAPISIFLGNIEPGTSQAFEIPLVNRLEVDLRPTDAERSCGCVTGSLQSDTMKIGEPFFLRVAIKFPNTGGEHFRQQLKLFDKNPVVAPLVFDFSATILEMLTLQPSVIHVDSADASVIEDLVVTSASESWDLAGSQVVSSTPGVTVTTSECVKSRMHLKVEIDPAKAFRGRLAEAVTLVVQNIKRAEGLHEAIVTCPIVFDRFLVAAPKKLVFAAVEDKIVGRIMILGNFSAQVASGSSVAESTIGELAITASWEDSHDHIQIDYTLVRPNAVTVSITLDDKSAMRNERIRFKVYPNNLELIVPIDIFDERSDFSSTLDGKESCYGTKDCGARRIGFHANV